MRFFPFFVALALALQIAQAADSLTFENCEALGIEKCDEFRQLNLSTNEQKQMFSSLLGIRSNMNIHDFIFDWNTKLNFGNIPNALLPENYKTIRDAWIALTNIMPSVLYGNILYNDYSGFIQTTYDYELTRPDTYFNGQWDVCGSGSTSSNEGEGGDCRTEYPENWDESKLNIYLNSNLIGNSSLASFNTTSTINNFESDINIVNKIKRNHYTWQQGNCCRCNHCCWYLYYYQMCGDDCGRCGCGTYSQSCRYSGTDYRYDSLILQDDKSSLLEEIYFSQPKILYDAARNTAYVIINTTRVDYYELIIGEYRILKRNLEYSYNYSYAPLNILTAKAVYRPRIDANVYSTFDEKNNSDFISFIVERKEIYDCKLKIYSYFNSFNLTCNITILPKTELNITTDKFFYMPNETMKVNISIKSSISASIDIIQIKYGNYTKNITGNTILQIPAQINVNQITAEYQTDLVKQSASAAKTVSIYAGEKPSYYVNIFWFVIGFLFFISALRMCWIKFFGVDND